MLFINCIVNSRAFCHEPLARGIGKPLPTFTTLNKLTYALVNWNPNPPGPGTDRGIIGACKHFWSEICPPGVVDKMCFASLYVPTSGNQGDLTAVEKAQGKEARPVSPRATHGEKLTEWISLCTMSLLWSGVQSSHLPERKTHRWVSMVPDGTLVYPVFSSGLYQCQIQSDLGDLRNVRIAISFAQGT